MWRIYGGAVLIIAGIVAFIEAQSHRLEIVTTRGVDLNGQIIGRGPLARANGLSATAYYSLRDSAWVLVILGVLTVAVGLAGYWRSSQSVARTP